MLLLPSLVCSLAWLGASLNQERFDVPAGACVREPSAQLCTGSKHYPNDMAAANKNWSAAGPRPSTSGYGNLGLRQVHGPAVSSDPSSPGNRPWIQQRKSSKRDGCSVRLDIGSEHYWLNDDIGASREVCFSTANANVQRVVYNRAGEFPKAERRLNACCVPSSWLKIQCAKTLPSQLVHFRKDVGRRNELTTRGSEEGRADYGVNSRHPGGIICCACDQRNTLLDPRYGGDEGIRAYCCSTRNSRRFVGAARKYNETHAPDFVDGSVAPRDSALRPAYHRAGCACACWNLRHAGRSLAR